MGGEGTGEGMRPLGLSTHLGVTARVVLVCGTAALRSFPLL